MKIIFAIYLVLVSADPGNWSTLKNEEFEFRYPQQLERTAGNIFEHAGKSRSRMEGLLGFEFDEQVLVILAPDREAFMSMQGGRVPEWASGTAYPAKRVIFLRPLDASEIRGNNIGTIFSHELAHVMLYHRLKERHPPRWLDEGVAMNLAGQLFFIRANQLLGVGVTGRNIPFSMLADSFPASGNEARLAYSQSADMVSYIRREFGSDAYFDLLDSLAEGDDIDAALEKSLGVTMEELEDGWLSSVRLRWGLVPILSGSFSLWFLISLLAIAAYLRKRRTSRLRRKLWEIEEGLWSDSSSPDEKNYLH